MARQRSEQPRDRMSPWRRGLRQIWVPKEDLEALRQAAGKRGVGRYVVELHNEKQRTGGQNENAGGSRRTEPNEGEFAGSTGER